MLDHFVPDLLVWIWAKRRLAPQSLMVSTMRQESQMQRAKLLLLSVLFCLLPLACSQGSTIVDDDAIGRAFANRASDVQVEGKGTVVRILSDDVNGPRHQRFIVELASGQTLLITHNIDIAPRINGLEVGDRVSFNGEYVWNAKGGVIHWTHHDPRGRHVAGWIRHKGKTYQ